jgi:hypothetical protein
VWFSGRGEVALKYAVKFTRDGPSGWVYYLEGGEALPFDWQMSTVGFDVYLPTSEEWPEFCDKHGALNARSRRDLIVERLTKAIKKQEAGPAKVSIDDNAISFSYEGSWSRAILRKILGLD